VVDRPDRGARFGQRGHCARVGGLVLIAVEYLDDLRKVSGDPAVAALLAGAATPFDRAEWWERLAQCCGLAPLYALARGPEGAALLALSEQAGTVRALANWYTFRWQPLADHHRDPAPLFAALALGLAGRAWRVTLDRVPDERGAAAALHAAFSAAGWFVSRRVDDWNHVLPVGGRSYADYLVTRPGPLRTTLARKSAGICCKIHRTLSDDIWSVYQAIYAASWKPREGSPEFLRRFASEEAAAGRLRLGVAAVAGEPVAVQLWTVERGTAYIHKLAHDPAFSGGSPGTVLTAALLRDVIDSDGVDLVDFGTGDDPFKADWMEDIRPRYQIDALRPGSPRAWPHIGKAVLRRRLRAGKGPPALWGPPSPPSPDTP